MLLLFLDGVGIGPADRDRNPFLLASLPFLRESLGGIPTFARPAMEGLRGRSFPLDATLGVPGLPQSGTGQTAILTGRNAAGIFGHHFGPWVPVDLRPMLAEENLLVRAGPSLRRAFANAYPEDFMERYPERMAAPPLAASSAGLLTRHSEALRRGDAVASGILNDLWRARLGPEDLPTPDAGEAGRNLAAIANAHDLTFFAHYETDHAGHRGTMEECWAALELVDRFLAGLIPALDPDITTLIVSDHGNIEDIRGDHTRNPALGVEFGPGLGRTPESILEVTPLVLERLGVTDPV